MRTHLRLASVGLVALAAVLTGCGKEHVQSFLDPGAPADPVAGEYVGDGPVRLFPDGSAPIRLTLRGGEISFSASCNQFSGRATWDDGILLASGLGGTEIGCLDNSQAQDEWMLDFFASSPTLELDGTDLAIRSGKDRVWFVPQDEVPSGEPGDAGDLVDTDWRLTGVGEYGGDWGTVASVPQGVVATVRFADDEVRIKPGCNEGGGAVRIGAGTITFSDGIALSAAECPDARGEVERDVMRVLRYTVSWSISGDELRLRTSDARHELVFHR